MMALGVAAIVATAVVLATLSLARTEKCKELAEAYERKRRVKRATSGWHLGFFSSKNAKAIRDAAKEYKPNRDESSEKEERLNELDARTAGIASSRDQEGDATRRQRSVNSRAAGRKEVSGAAKGSVSPRNSRERHTAAGGTGLGHQPVRSPKRDAVTFQEVVPTARVSRTTSTSLKALASPSPSSSQRNPPPGSTSDDATPSAPALWLGLFSR
jgi:hypothetical protein